MTENSGGKTPSPDPGPDNAELERAMLNLREAGTRLNAERVTALLAAARVIVPFGLAGGDRDGVSVRGTGGGRGEVTIAGGTRLNLVLLSEKGGDGGAWCPVFTSKAESDKITVPASGMLIQPFAAIARIVLAENSGIRGITVNPFGICMTFDADTVRAVLNRAEKAAEARRYTVKAGDRVVISEPREPAEELRAALAAALRKHKNAERAWLRLMIRPGAPEETRASYLVVVETGAKPEELAPLFRELAGIAAPHAGGKPLDFLRYDPDGTFAADAVGDARPFYRRKKFGLF